MSKLLVMPKNIDITKLNQYCDGYIFGLQDYSVNLPCEITLDEVKELDKICRDNNKIGETDANYNLIYTLRDNNNQKIILRYYSFISSFNK